LESLGYLPVEKIGITQVSYEYHIVSHEYQMSIHPNIKKERRTTSLKRDVMYKASFPAILQNQCLLGKGHPTIINIIKTSSEDY
jgi:hypothetical protein